MDFDAYDLDAAGLRRDVPARRRPPRAHCRALYDTLRRLSGDELGRIQERVTHSFLTRASRSPSTGTTRRTNASSPSTACPGSSPAAEWRQLETGLTQRLAALNHFLEDVYGEARIVADGVVPADLVRGCPQYRIEMRGVSVPHGAWVAICGTDLVRTRGRLPGAGGQPARPLGSCPT